MTSLTAKTVTGHRQRGAALVVSLIFLLLLTLIGVSAMRTTTLEEKMAGNLRDRTIAFEASEAALRAGERLIAELEAEPAARIDCGSLEEGECFNKDSWVAHLEDGDSTTPDARWKTLKVEGADGTRYHLRYARYKKFSINTGGHDDEAGVVIFQVTACSEGATDLDGSGCVSGAKTVLQTNYQRRF